ncbi:cytidine deaminase [Pseudoalteromonas piratica]|uniref:cytidine deaminase n=1 Tax=Pseudoalteromonas piratica TaxID=1348114 RepID=UPI0019019647|nr:cytidine deaminase [Pseudoalteromonas piratica]
MATHSQFESAIKKYTEHKSFLTREEVNALSSLFDDEKVFYDVLLKWVSDYAIAPISNFLVAALALESGDQGRLFFGANLEFESEALSLVVHAEQSAIHNALIHSASSIEKLIINASPCGYCRQFINEIEHDKQPQISVHGEVKTIQDYLPDAFGPSDLDNNSPLFSRPFDKCSEIDDYFKQSYAPYSGNRAACQITEVNNKTYFGVYLENAAYSPSLSPLQAALNQMQLHNRETGLAGIESIYIRQSHGKSNQQGVAVAVANRLGEGIKVTFEEV